MTDRFREKIEEQYQRAMLTIPVVADNPRELLVLMTLAVYLNNRMSPKQKDHTIDNILKYDLHEVAWTTKAYQLERLRYHIKSALAGIPAPTKREAIETITKASIENRVISILEHFLIEQPVTTTLETISKELAYPKGNLEYEYTVLKSAGLIQEVEGKAKLTDEGIKFLHSQLEAK